MSYVTFGAGNDATPPDGTKIEIETRPDGSDRQIIRLGPSYDQLSVAAINFSSSGDNTVITAGGGGQKIYVYKLYLVTSSPTDLQFKDGAVTDAAIPMTSGGSMSLDFDSEPWFVGAANTAFKINSTNAVQVGGRIYYVKL